MNRIHVAAPEGLGVAGTMQGRTPCAHPGVSPIQTIQDEDAGALLEGGGRQVSHELIGLTVMDGFKFGCGFALALAIGLLAALIVVTVFGALGALIGVRLPGA